MVKAPRLSLQLFLSLLFHSRLSKLMMVFVLFCNLLCFQKWLFFFYFSPSIETQLCLFQAHFLLCCVRLPRLRFKVPENVMNSLISAGSLNTSQVLYTWPF